MGVQGAALAGVLFPAVSLLSGFSQNRRAELQTLSGFPIRLPTGIGRRIWLQHIPSDNPMTTDKVALGKDLFFDPRLSKDRTVSCASCHDPANAFTDHAQTARGISNERGTRNTPTVLNAMFNERFFWDGRAGSLEAQALQPMINKSERGMGCGDLVVQRLYAEPEYRRRFRTVFGREGITVDTITKAIAA